MTYDQLAFRMSFVKPKDINEAINIANDVASYLVQDLGCLPGTDIVFRPIEKFVDPKKIGVYEPSAKPGRIYF